MTRDRCIGYIVLLFLASALLGCGGYKNLSIKMSLAACDRNPERVFASEKGQYCVMWIKDSDLSAFYIDSAVARVPEDVVIYGLKSFLGYTGEEREFEKIVSAIVKGIELKGRVFIYAFTPKSMYVVITYSEKEKHLLFQDLGKAGQKVVGAVDLSDVDVTVKPETSANTLDMEAELRKIKKLRDEGLITEKDYEQMKSRIIGK